MAGEVAGEVAMKIIPNGLKKNAFGMRKKVTYEWVMESVDEHGDIQDSDFGSKLSDFPIDKVLQTIKTSTLALVRNSWIDYGDGENGELDDKSWAYVSDEKLPVEFDNGSPVPMKYLTEYQILVNQL